MLGLPRILSLFRNEFNSNQPTSVAPRSEAGQHEGRLLYD